MRAFVGCPVRTVAGFCCGLHRLVTPDCCVSFATMELRRTFVGHTTSQVSSSSSVNVAAAAPPSMSEDDAAVPPLHPEASGQAIKGFRRDLRFSRSSSQVTPENMPSAKEIEEMIPTIQELRAQLPDAKEVRKMYNRPDSVKMSGASGLAEMHDNTVVATGSSSTSTSLFENITDPLEDLLFGPPKDQSAAANEATSAASEQQSSLSSRQHLFLAYRALFWGTTFAVLGFTTTVAAVMYLCGYRCLRDLQQGVREKVSRDEDRLRATAAAHIDGSHGDAEDTSLVHYVIDLSQPTVAWQQVQEILGALQQLAEKEERLNTSVAAASQ